MLSISLSQQRQLASAWRGRYMASLQVRLAERNPELVATLDQAALRGVVADAVRAAEAKGFTQRGPIRLYLDLCIAFGSGFVDDPMYPWARTAIGPADPSTEAERAEALFTSSCAAADAVHGPQDRHWRDSLVALLRWSREEAQPEPETGLGHHVISVLVSLHPQKAAYVGEEALRALVIEAAADCSEYGLDARRALTLFCALKFAFGANCHSDPAHPWLARVLTDDRLPDPRMRQAALRQALAAWLSDFVAACAARG